MISVTAWVQNKEDNEADYILKDGQIISIDCKKSREEITKQIFEVERNSKYLVHINEAYIKRYKSIYLIKLHVNKTDDNKRKMPVLILIKNIKNNSLKSIHDQLINTLKISPTPINSELITTICDLISKDFKNLRAKKVIFSVVVTGIVALGLYYHLSQ